MEYFFVPDDLSKSQWVNPSGLVWKQEYSARTRSVPWLLMTWFLGLPGHQQPWYWLCLINKSLSLIRNDFNCLCHLSVEKWLKKCKYIFIFPKNEFRATRSNSLWPSDAICWHRTGSKLAQVAWQHQAVTWINVDLSYLSSTVQWHSSRGNFTKKTPHPSITNISLKISCLKFHFNLPGVIELLRWMSMVIGHLSRIEIWLQFYFNIMYAWWNVVHMIKPIDFSSCFNNISSTLEPISYPYREACPETPPYFVVLISCIIWELTYHKISSISRTESQNLNVSCLVLQLSSLNPLKPGVELRMKM